MNLSLPTPKSEETRDESVLVHRGAGCVLPNAPEQTQKQLSFYRILRGASGPEIPGSPLFPEPGLDPDLLILNRWDTVKFPALPGFSPLSLLPPMVAALAADWNLRSKEPVACSLSELREPRGNEVPKEWPRRRRQYREDYAIIASSRIPVERPDQIAWRRHDLPPLNYTQVKFVRGRAVPG